MAPRTGTKADLLREVAELKARLEESETTLEAIRCAEVDALVMHGRVLTLEGPESPYRHLVEAMSDGAATLAEDGTVLHASRRLAALLGVPLETLIGSPLRGFVAASDLPVFDATMAQGMTGFARGELAFRRSDGTSVPVLVSCSARAVEGARGICLIAADVTEQKRNQAILASEALSRAILDQAAEAIVVCDASGTIVRASREAFRLAGHECLGRKFAEAFPLEITGVGRAETLVERALAGVSFHTVEAQVQRPHSSETSWLLVSAAPLHDARERGCVITLVDDTERRRIRTDLRASEERYRVLVDLAPDPIIVHANGRIAYANSAALHLLGAPSPDALIGTPILERVHPDDRRTVEERTAVVGRGRTAALRALRMLRLDGETVDVEATASAIEYAHESAVQVILRDIRERKKAEVAVRESQLLLEVVLKSVADPVYVKDRDSRILMANPALAEVVGKPLDEIIGRTDAEYYGDAATGEVLHEHDLRVMESGEGDVTEETVPTPLGPRTFLSGKAPFRNAAGEIVGIVGISRDITDRKAVEDDLRQSEERYRALVDSAPDGILVHREGTLLYVNPAALRLFGARSFEELRLRPVLALVPPGDRDQASARIERVAKGEPLPRREARIVRLDGREVPVESAATPVEYGGTRAVLVFFRDVSERKEAEEALRKSEATLRGILNATQESIWLFDSDGVVRQANDIALARMGRTAEETIGRRMDQVLDTELARSRMARLREVLESRLPVEFEDRRADYSFRHTFYPVFDNAGSVSGVVSFSRDITERKRAREERERSLLEARERAAELEAVLAAQSDAVLTYDTEKRVRGANPSFLATYGFDPTGFHVTEVMQRVSCRTFDGSPMILEEQPTPRALRGEATSGALYRVRRADASEAVVESSSGAMRLGDRITGAVTVWHDTTARLNAEEALQRSAGELQAVNLALRRQAELIDLSPNAYIVRALDGTISFWSRGAEALYGWTREEALGRVSHELLATRFPSPVEDLDAGLRTAGKWSGELVHRVKDGRTIVVQSRWLAWRDARGGIAELLECNTDITERKRAEDALRELNASLERRVAERTTELRRASEYNRNLLETSLDPLVTISPDGKVTDVNAATEKVTGRSRPELVGTDFSDYFTEPERARAGYQKVFREGVVQDYPLEIRHRDGRVTPVLYNASVYRDASGEVVGVFAAARDVSERRRAEAEIRAYQQHLEELVEHRTAELRRSNENLEQFAYVASHDLQEPLRMMASYSELLERRYRDRLDADASEFIAFIVDGAVRMQRLINDLLAYSRVGRTGTRDEPVDCNAVLVKVKDGLAATIEETHAVVEGEPLPVVIGSESQLFQLFQNLVGNAIKFHGPEPPRVHVSATQRSGKWLFSVKDNGIGIEPQYAERIFQVFQRLHARGEYPGTGIGLAICKKIVESGGGRIWVESEPGHGSTFLFTLPRKGEAADA